MWMHTADNDCIVWLSHAALVTVVSYAIIQRQFTDLFLLRNNIIKYQLNCFSVISQMSKVSL